MLLSSDNNLENAVINTLTKKGRRLASELQESLRMVGVKATIQGIYRVLRKLQNEGIVLKEGQRYSLRLPWVIDLARLVGEMEETYLRSDYIRDFIPTRNNEKRVWVFSQLFKMNDFWSQVLIALAKNSKTKIMLDYSPHAWFHLVQPEQELQYLKSLLTILKKQYTIIGGQYYLDKFTEKFYKFDNLEYYLAPPVHWPEKDRSKSLSIIDNFVLTAKFDKQTTKIIDELYEKITPKGTMNFSTITHLLTRQVRVRLKLERSDKKARIYLRRFQKVFGRI